MHSYQLQSKSMKESFRSLTGNLIHLPNALKLTLKCFVFQFLVALGWALATAIGLAVLYGLSDLLDPLTVPEINAATKVIYGTFHRLAWAIAVGWVIFACVSGYGGPVDRFLSWKAFMPLSRITYCVYLIHFSLLVLYVSRMRAPLYYSTFDVILFFFAIIVTVFGIGFVVSITIEASFLNLEKLLFSFGKKSSKEPVKSNQADAHIGEEGDIEAPKISATIMS